MIPIIGMLENLGKELSKSKIENLDFDYYLDFSPTKKETSGLLLGNPNVPGREFYVSLSFSVRWELHPITSVVTRSHLKAWTKRDEFSQRMLP